MTAQRDVLRHRRMAQRVFDEDGFLVSRIAPEHTHGRAMGRIQFGCCCKPCREWSWHSQLRRRESKAHNLRIIEALRNKSCPQAPELAPETPEPTKVVLPTEAQVDEEKLTRALSTIRTPSKKTNGHKVTKPTTERVLTRPKVDPNRRPPVTPGVRDYIKDVATYEAIAKAYYEPQVVSPAVEPGRERRTYEDMEIIVAKGGTYPVIWFKRRAEVGAGPSQLLAEKPKATPKAKGGRGGSQGPTDLKALLKALEASGCKIERTGSGHIKVTRDGKTMTLPSTASDWRSLKNSLAQARKDGML
jgi:hypothetical protein